MTGFTAMDFLQAMALAGARIDQTINSDCRNKTLEILRRHGIPGKVLASHATTCSERGYWDYGVSCLYGWVTHEGLAKLREMGRLEDGDQ